MSSHKLFSLVYLRLFRFLLYSHSTKNNFSHSNNQSAVNQQQTKPVIDNKKPDHRIVRTGASQILTALSAFFVVLLLIVIFIFQNMGRVNISFLWMHGSVPIALAMLLSVISGALLMALAAGARVLQLRHTAARHRNDDLAAEL